MVKTFLIFILLMVTAGTSQAVLVVNEVMSNPPDNNQGAEWIEIHNNGTSSTYLGFFTLRVDGWNFAMPETGVSAGRYFILCKSSIVFEQIYGDNSGTWGDNSTLENYPIFQISAFDLDEESGIVEIVYGGTVVTDLDWDTPGAPGVSWERIHPDSTAAYQSTFATGSTPGKVNSITPLNNDLKLVSMDVTLLDNGSSFFEFMIANIGFNVMLSGDLKLYYDNDNDGTITQADLIVIVSYQRTNPGDTLKISTTVALDGIYPYVLALLPADDRTYNNKLSVKAFGSDYPPLYISEFLPDPKTPLGTEWIELYNKSSFEVNLNGWYIGDAIKFSPLVHDDYYVDSNQYIILCQDSAEFQNYYNLPDVQIIELGSWPALNNDEDMLRLRDELGFLIDSFEYKFTYGDNYSWAMNGDGDWGRSSEVGGSPGDSNIVYVAPQGDKIAISIEPNPFSPTIDQYTSISFDNPPGDDMVIKVYDRKGRMVKSIYEDVPSFNGTVEWDGRDDEGDLLPVGIYILYIDISGVESHKETVVIAP